MILSNERSYLQGPKAAIYREEERQTIPGLNGSAVSSRVAMLMIQSLVGARLRANE